MAEVQVQPAPIAESTLENQAEDKDALIIRLDELLEKYLHTLDAYQKTREQLSKQLSSVSHTRFRFLKIHC
jgi:septal ring factor EnvC (AmiA/AmiB activator)